MHIQGAFDGVPGPGTLRGTHDTFLDSLHKQRKIRKRGNCWEEQPITVFSRRGFINLPSMQINEFFLPVVPPLYLIACTPLVKMEQKLTREMK